MVGYLELWIAYPLCGGVGREVGFQEERHSGGFCRPEERRRTEGERVGMKEEKEEEGVKEKERVETTPDRKGSRSLGVRGLGFFLGVSGGGKEK